MVDLDKISERAERRRRGARQRKRSGRLLEEPSERPRRRHRDRPPQDRPLRGVDLDALARRLDLDDGEMRERVETVVRRVAPATVLDAIDEEREDAGLTRKVLALHAVVAALGLLWLEVSEEASGLTVLMILSVTALMVLIALNSWLRGAFRNMADLHLGKVPYTPNGITWGFINPLVAWIRPYRALVYLHRASDPELLPDVPELIENTGGDPYRSPPAMLRPSTATIPDPRLPIGLFWIAFLFDAFPHFPINVRVGIYMAVGALGVAVVRGIDQRRTELLRRIDAILGAAAELREPRPAKRRRRTSKRVATGKGKKLKA